MFGKKKKEEKPIPIDDVKQMAGRGLSDKDIIKELKHRGYAYDEIEKAMLQAVKQGVDDDAPPMYNYNNTYQQSQPYNNYAPVPEDPFAQQQPQADLPNFEEMPEDDTSAVLEELIEGVIEEKWHAYEDKFTKMEESFEKIKIEIKQFQVQMTQQKNESPQRELEVRLSDLSQQLEDLDARVGGLEKAFKQFLPSLTRNIESLSHMIHEMKEKQHLEPIEEEM